MLTKAGSWSTSKALPTTADVIFQAADCLKDLVSALHIAVMIAAYTSLKVSRRGVAF